LRQEKDNVKGIQLLLASVLLTVAAKGHCQQITGQQVEALKPFDDLMTEFVRTHQAPGAALAVTKNGRLVYARGFGWANLEDKIPAQPDSIFRIASISKPITAVAILQLVEKGKLRLDDKVFDILKYTPHLEPGCKADPRLKDITILHLLHHTAGWDRAESFAPMGIEGTLKIADALGVSPPGQQSDIIRYMMGLPLDFDPGTKVVYSNFGYLLLGRVIEKITGQTYEDYVKRNVLGPLGITEMRIGRTAKEHRAPKEVTYYDERGRTTTARFGPQAGKTVPLPYARCVEIMDSHGGWIASAIDLARFSVAFDHPARCKILTEESIKKMFARPAGVGGYDPNSEPLPAYYACGWDVRPKGDGKQNTWHKGGIEGTSALLVRRYDGLNWAVLFNTHGNPEGKSLSDLIDHPLHPAANSVTTWPQQDFFPSYR